MKQETNNEMDLLLRRLGRQQDTSATSNHLDADELSSFSENVLPPAARARYTEHLAECARCRDLVVQLSSSAGLVVAHETAKVSGPSALRKFLASFFSPMVLRYAVPALGLVVVAAIGFMVSRNEGSNSPVAEVINQQPVQATVPASQPQPSASTDKELSDFYDNKEPAANKAVPQHGEAAAQAGAVAPSAPTVAADAPQEKPAKTVEEVQPLAKEAPPPQPTPEVAEAKKLEAQGRKQEAAEQTVTIQSEPGKLKRDDRSVGDFAAATPSVARNRAESGIASAGAATRVTQAKDAEKDEDDAETRTVAGRRFRKQGGVWVDTAYTSTRRITAEYKRGSEGYRTLVGDEPEIKRIADQLDGEIIVVWKGQVYKIR